jgi:ABC-2 type transport system permease protein
MDFHADITGDLKDMLLTARFELLRLVRQKRILIAVLIVVTVPLIFYAVPPLCGIDYASTAVGFASGNLNFISPLIIISAAIMVGDSISGEFEKKTGLMLFPTPQRKTSIYVGKYLAAVLTLFSIVSIYYLMTLWEMVTIYGSSDIPVALGKSYVLALLYSSSVTSVFYFFSSFMKRTITSSIVGFFLMMMILPMIVGVLQMVSVDPWFIVTNAGSLISNVLGQPVNRFGPEQQITSVNSFTPDFFVGCCVMFFYSVILFWTALVIASRRKME